MAAFCSAKLASAAVASAVPAEGFRNESEAGVVITSGNARSQNYQFKQSDVYRWESNLLKAEGRFLKSSSRGVETARFWTVGARYERELLDRFSLFAAQNIESDRFAGYLQRYNSDVGGKYFFVKEEAFSWLGEAGYRYTAENRIDASRRNTSALRFYTEANRSWNTSVSSKLWIEYLPNLTASKEYRINAEASLSAALSDVFSVKTAYLLKFNHFPAPGATEKTDTWFTTSLVAQF